MNAIVAVSNDWGIGLGGGQTAVIHGDRCRFMELTRGGVVIVGRKTFESFPEPLPDRKHIVLTRNHGFTASDITNNVKIVHSVSDVINEIKGFDPDKVFVIGGGDIYRLFLPFCDYAYVTKIELSPVSDTFFPNLDELPGWMIVRKESFNEQQIRYSFINYRMKTGD